jgi:filamentous hemagglutinin family protein
MAPHPLQYYATIAIAVAFQGIMAEVSIAQVVPDGTLSTQVTVGGSDFTITQGDRLGNNLFHSFSQFSVPTGGSAVFNHAADVQNIFSRITGAAVSNIDGLVQAQGAANLFLLNPNGIIFGPNARLTIGGSFLGTTANRIKFSDGVEFGPGSPTALLTVSLPIGLQMGQTPGTIQNAANLPSLSPFAPFIPGGLQVQPGKSLGLLGGNVSFDGGAVTALNGQLEVGAVGANSFVGLTERDFGFELNYDRVQSFQDVRLQNLAALDARDGGVQVRGRQISLLNGSHILTDLLQAKASRGITLEATESINLVGFRPVDTPGGPLDVPVYLSSGTTPDPAGIGGNISLTAPTITIADRATVASSTLMGKGGNIRAQANQLNLINGYIYAGVFGSGQGGNLLLQVNDLNVLNGGQVGAATYGDGNSGNLTIEAKDVQVSGTTQFDGLSFLFPAVLFTTTADGTGKGGTFSIQTDRLRVTDGGILAATTFGRGNAGNLMIQAKDSVELAQANQTSGYPTGLVADAALAPGRPQDLSGNAGNIQVTTGRLLIESGGTIAVGNPGSGDSGSLTIDAGSVTLRGGTLNAAIASGKKGNIAINTNVLLLRDGSKIITNASSQANGGDISINAPIVVGLENSDVIANAAKGSGGNISITAQRIIGLSFRNTLTPFTDPTNDITASSEVGIDGTVQINGLGLDPNSGLTALPVDTVDPSQKIATGCAQNTGGSFVVTGRGGTASNPLQIVTIDRPWLDMRGGANPQPVKVQTTANAAPIPLEADAWQVNAQGQIELIAAGNPGAKTILATCARS